MVQRGGEVTIQLLENVQQKTISPIIQVFITPGMLVHTDEYGIYVPLLAWGYGHETVCHSAETSYLSFFEFVHNVRRRSKALVGNLLETILASSSKPRLSQRHIPLILWGWGQRIGFQTDRNWLHPPNFRGIFLNCSV